MDARIGDQSAPTTNVGTHPEEMKGTLNVQVGSNVTLRAAGRTTPAGVISTGLAIAAVVLAVAALVRALNRPASF